MPNYDKNYKIENIPEGFVPLKYKNIKENMYGINEYGEIWSNYKKSLIIPTEDADGYLHCSLSTTANKKICVRISTLVIVTFCGYPSKYLKDPTVNHIDSNKKNNHISNLEWMERGKNSSIRKNKGQGILNHEAKLTEEQVEEVCVYIVNTNMSFGDIAKIVGVHSSTINNIVRGENWKSITNKYGDLKKYRKHYRGKDGRFCSYNPFINKEVSNDLPHTKHRF